MPKPKKKRTADASGQPPAAEGIVVGKEVGGKGGIGNDVILPLRTLVLHGMIGGSTGTGKTRAIQVIAEKLVERGVPVLLADLKGDISGFIRPNDDDASAARAEQMGISYSPAAFPAVSFSVSSRFVPLRLRLDAIDPTLLARILKLNPTQESNLKMSFLYAKGRNLPVRDFVDLEAVLAHIAAHPEAASGASPSSINVILRQIGIAKGEGLDELFGEPALEIRDLLVPRVNAVSLSDWRKSSELPSILMAFILFRLFNELEDVGSVETPRLALFIDEAHYLFQDANPSLVSLFVTILKQIRSKGVAVFLSSQNPEDIPEKVLEQLGCKIEFALRAFTKEEMADIGGIARSFPPTKRYDLAQEILSLKIGEAFLSPLGPDGRPLEPTKAMMEPPRSSMGVLRDDEISGSLDKALLEKYGGTAEMERYDLSSPFDRLRVGRRDGWSAARAEAERYERKQSRMVSRSWSRWKMAGLFVLAALVLVIVIILLIALVAMILK